MTFSEWSNKKKKKEQEEAARTTTTKNTVNATDANKKTSATKQTFSEWSNQKYGVDDIAPVKTTVTTTTKKDEEEDDRKWFQKGAFEDGYQFGDVFKTLLGTATDVVENVGAGVLGMGEKALDAIAYVSPLIAQGQYYQNGGVYHSQQTQKMFNESIEESKKWSADFIKKDLYDEEEIAKKIVIGTDKNSVLGEKSDALVQSGGQLLATAGLQAAGVPWFLTTGATSFGSQTEAALNDDAGYEAAGLSAAVSAGAEILTEKLSGGIKFGGKTLDDVLLKPLTEKIANKTVKTLVNLGVDAVGEGAEEVVSGVFSNLGTAIYKEDGIEELLFSEEAVDEYIESFIGGAVLGGIGSGVQAIQDSKRIQLTENEQKVVDAVYEERIEGQNLTEKQKNNIRSEVIRDMLRGYISTDTIEEVLGGETYQSWKDTVDSEDALQQEFDTLNKMKQGDMTGEQVDRRTELKAKLEEIKKNSQRDTLKEQLGNEVMSLVQSDRLAESYNERSRRGQAYEADLTKYDTKQQATIQKAIDSGILNNTNRTHEFVDMIAKITADKGVLFDFTNNEKLKNSGFAVDGKAVNGYVTKDGVVLNIDSNKSMNSVVGHEITHVLEGTELYQTLQDVVTEYAKTKGEYQGRYDALTKLYEGVEGADINAELTADLVGDYLFTDTDFVKNLSVQHRNVFQKIYDEIKYLCKVATAGSKEARELEKVKRVFEDAYKADSKAQTDTKYSIGEIVDTDNHSYGIGVHLNSTLLDNLTPDERKVMVKERIKELGGEVFTAFDNNGNAVDITIAKSNAYYKTENGKRRPVNNDLTRKYIDNEVKQEAVVLIDELIATSKFQGTDPAKHPHGWIDNNGQNDWDVWTTYIQDKNNTIWAATLHIANTANGEKIIYDVVPTEKVGQSGKSDTSLLNDNVAQEAQDVKAEGQTKFSLSEPVEETKELVAVHNLHTAELLETLKLSGLPSPSVAIIKAKDGHEKYGDVSLILPKEAIDPQANKANRIYGSDAWTPTRSNAQVEYEVDYDKQRQFERNIEQLAKNVANGVFSKSSVLGMAGVEGSTDLNLNEIAKKISDYDAVQAAYVAETGGNVEVVYRAKEFDTYGNKALKSYIDSVGEQEVARLAAKMLTGERLSAEEIETAKDAIVDDWTAKKEYALKQKPELRDMRIAKFREKLTHLRTEDFIRHAWEFYEDSGATTDEIDRGATGNNLRAAANRADVEAWVAEKLQGLLSEPGIYNGKDLFTPSGRSRSFKETHWEYTAENIVRAMNNADARGANVWNVSGEAIIATATSEYKNIDEVRTDKDRLTKADDDYYKQIKDDISAELQAVTKDIVRTTKHISDNQYDEEQIIGRVIMEAAQGAKTSAGVKRVFQKNGYGISDAQAKSVLSLFDHASNVPTGYFEAKPQRVVGFDEVGVYVIPNNADVKLKQELLNRGYSIAEYDPNIEGHRQQVVNQFEEYKFSLSDVGTETANADSLSALKLETAPVSNAEPNAEGVSNANSNAPMAQDDIAPVKKTATSRSAASVPNKAYENSWDLQNKAQNGWNLFKDNVVDKGTIFETMSLKTGNRDLQAKWKAVGRAESSAQWFMEHGNTNAKSLKAIMEPVEKSGKTKKFEDYLYHMHNVDRMKVNKPVFGSDVTAEMSAAEAARLERENPEFKRWANDVYSYMGELREMLVENGMISVKTRNLLMERYPHYVPIRRSGKDAEGFSSVRDTNRTGVNAPIKKATGGSRKIEPLFDTMALRTEETFKAVAKNNFGLELKNMLGTTVDSETTGVDDVIDNVGEEMLQPSTDGRAPTFSVYENGERVTFDINDEMYNAMKPKSGFATYTNKVLNTANNVRRGLLTEYNPAFMLTNPIKDTQDVLMNSQHPARTYANYPKAIGELLGKGQYYQEYMEHGGDQNTFFDGEAKAFVKDKPGWKKVIGFPLEKISQINNFIERVPRMAEYIASRKEGRSIDVSMLDAARVTTDFSAGGDAVRVLNRNGFTFLNASVQGAVQQVRNVREAKAEGLKGWAKLAAKTAVAGLSAELLNSLLWEDDEDYEDLSDYVKQNYYVVAKYDDGKFVRIPKGRTVAVIQDAFEQMKNLITGDDETDFGAFAELVISNLAPSNPLENNLIAPIMQAYNNETWYGDDLVPSRLQDLPAAEQYDETTDSISKWLGEKVSNSAAVEWFNERFGTNLELSPYKINYLLDQYSGAIGDVFLPMYTPEAERGNDDWWGDLIAPISDKFTTDSVLKNQNVTDFYDKRDELEVIANDRNATKDDELKRVFVDAVSWEMSDLYAQKREIQNSDMSDSEKYNAVRELQKKIDALAENGLNGYEDVYSDGAYAEVGDRRFSYDKDKDTWYEIKKKNSDGSDNWYYTQEQLFSDKLGVSYSDYWNGNFDPATDTVKTHYGEMNGKRYNYDEENNMWYEIRQKNDDGSDNWYYQKEQEVTKGLGISYEEYWNNREEYNYAFDKPENYAVAKAVGGYEAYKGYNSDLYDIKADKDENGKIISGSRKEKVLDYINNLDADYYTRIILWKSEYNSDDSYNVEIIDYLNGRDDLSFADRVTILRKLGFDVTDDGDISW